jgi:hypothetical protein
MMQRSDVVRARANVAGNMCCTVGVVFSVGRDDVW